MSKKCEDCVNWHKGLTVPGECRQQPPIAVNQQHGAVFPSAAKDDWCGYWHPRPKNDAG